MHTVLSRALVQCQSQPIGPTNVLAAVHAVGEQRLISLKCRATIGAVSNPQNKNRVLGKAGANRWRGRRPTVSSGCA